MKNKIRIWILKRLFTEIDLMLIKESINESYTKCYNSLGEAFGSGGYKTKDIIKVRNKFNFVKKEYINIGDE